jgi:hypothetical protein
MSAKEQPVIMFESPEAAQLKTVIGWVSRSGHFWGNDQRMARWDGCTHQLCGDGCGTAVERSYTRCEGCQDKRDAAAYMELDRDDWDGVTPLWSDAADRMFFSASDLQDYCRDEGKQPRELRLLLCDACSFHFIDEDDFADDLPEDCEAPDELRQALRKFNESIKEINDKGIGAWQATRVAAVVPDFTQEELA